VPTEAAARGGPPAHRWPRARTALLFVAPTLALCLLLLEAGLRLQGRLPSNLTDGIFESHGPTYRLRPRKTKLSRTPSFTYTIHSNDLGLRDRSAGPRVLGPAPYDAFLGDSLTFGNGVDYEETFVGVYAQQAAREGIEVLNLAMGGHRLGDQERLLVDILGSTPQKPARVVVVATKEFITGFEQDQQDLLILNGYLYSRRHWVVPFVTVTLGDLSAAYSFFRDGIRKVQGQVSPARSRAAALAFLEDFSNASPWAGGELPARLEARLQALDARIRGMGAAPVYVYLPIFRELVVDDFLALAGRSAADHDFRRFEKLVRMHASREGIAFVDLSPTARALHGQGAPVAFMQDPHYNATANLALGQALAQALLPSFGPQPTR